MVKTRLVNVALFLAILLGLALMIWVVLPRLAVSGSSPRINNTATLLKQVQTLSQLVTVKYVLEKVILLEDPKWYGESRVLMVAHGIVKAGVDLSEIRPQDINLDVSRKKVLLKLPPARITDAYLDDKHTQIVERTTGVLRAFDKDLEQNARRQAVDDINRAARNSGILKDAEDRASAQLTNLFRQLGFEEVEIQSP
jgi:hypothetical protein